MDPLDSFRKLARSLPRDKFVERHGYPFLVKPPVAPPLEGADDDDDGPWGDGFSFRTRVLPADADSSDLLDEAGPIAREWRVVEVKKRQGNPFPDRISVGRAKNCDVVLRFPSVSKLHAHFLLRAADGSLRLEDKQSANRTFLNGRALRPSVPTGIKSGDRVRFGAIELDYLDAGAFYALLLKP